MQAPRQDSGHSNFPYARYAEKCFTQINRDLYGDVMLERIWMGGNPGEVLPLMAYTGRLRPKEVPFSCFRYIKG